MQMREACLLQACEEKNICAPPPPSGRGEGVLKPPEMTNSLLAVEMLTLTLQYQPGALA